MRFPLISSIALEPGAQYLDDFDRLSSLLGDLEGFEVDYDWDPRLDVAITPPIFSEWNQLSRKIGEQFTRGARRVLSIGGGGLTPTVDYLSADAEYLCVVNPSRHSLNLYRERCIADLRILLVRGVGEHLPFENGSFDLVEIPSSLDHCLDPTRVLSESYRVLQRGGHIAISGGNEASWYRRAFTKLALPYVDKHADHHTMHMSPEMLESMLIAAGFSGVGVSSNYFLKLPKFVERRIRSSKALEVHQFISNSLLPGIMGRTGGGMILVGAIK